MKEGPPEVNWSMLLPPSRTTQSLPKGRDSVLSFKTTKINIWPLIFLHIRSQRAFSIKDQIVNTKGSEVIIISQCIVTYTPIDSMQTKWGWSYSNKSLFLKINSGLDLVQNKFIGLCHKPFSSEVFVLFFLIVRMLYIQRILTFCLLHTLQIFCFSCLYLLFWIFGGNVKV